VNYNGTQVFIYLFLSSVIVWCDAEHKRTTEFEAARLKDLARLSIVQFQNGFHRLSFRMIPNL